MPETILITGAAGTLGQVLVKRFLDSGLGVVGIDRDADGLSRLKQDCVGSDGDLTTYQCDLADDDDRETLSRVLLETNATVSTQVLNAGITRQQAFTEISLSDWRRVFEVNFFGQISLASSCVDLMRGASNPSMVMIGSTLPLNPIPGSSAYVASKAALLAMVRALSIELAPRGIRVNAVSPGAFASPILNHLSPEEERNWAADLLATRPLKRLTTAEEVAEAVVFLASRRASGISGVELLVDGGAANMHPSAVVQRIGSGRGA